MTSVIVKDAAVGITPEVRAQARRFGLSFGSTRRENKSQKEFKIIEGFIVEAKQRGQVTLVTIVALAPKWFFAGFVLRPVYEGGNVEGAALLPGFHHTMPAAYSASAREPPEDPIEPTVFSFDEVGYFDFKYKTYTSPGASEAINSLLYKYTTGACTAHREVTCLPFLTHKNATADVEFDAPMYFYAMLTSGASERKYAIRREDENRNAAKNMINGRALIFTADTFRVGAKFSEFSYQLASTIGCGSTPYAAVVKEEVPEVIGGVAQPLRYNDVFVAAKIHTGKALLDPDASEYWAGATGKQYSMQSSCGIGFARVHMPYDRETTGRQPMETVWGTGHYMTDAGNPSGVGVDFVEWNRPEPGGGWPPEYGAPETYEFLPEHNILAMSTAVREPVELESTSKHAVDVGTGAAQGIIVCTSISGQQYEPYDGGFDDYITPSLVYNARVYTVGLATGDYSITSLYTNEYIYTEDAPPPPFVGDVIYPYAAAGQAIPLVTVEISAFPEEAFWQYAEIEGDEIYPTQFDGCEENIRFSMLYASGNRIEYSLGEWCPPMPIMRGSDSIINSVSGTRDTQAMFRYNTANYGSEAHTIWANYGIGDAAPYIDGADPGYKNSIRYVDPTKTGCQRIAADLGDGLIGILVCAESQRASDTKLDWRVAICAENTGELLSVTDAVFSGLPLEASNWISINCISKAVVDENGVIKKQPVIACAVNVPVFIWQHATVFFPALPGEPAYSGGLINRYIRHINSPEVRTHITSGVDASFGAAGSYNPRSAYESTTKISRDGGSTWSVALDGFGAEVYSLGNALRNNSN